MGTCRQYFTWEYTHWAIPSTFNQFVLFYLVKVENRKTALDRGQTDRVDLDR